MTEDGEQEVMKDLDLDERILLYLYGLSQSVSEMEAPHGCSQAGLSEAMGFGRTHATRVLRPLLDRGMIEKRKCHIRDAGCARRMWAYSLTDQGVREARTIISRRGLSMVQIMEMGRDPLPCTRARPRSEAMTLEQIRSVHGLDEDDAWAVLSISGGDPDVVRLLMERTYPGEDGLAREERYMLRYMRLREEGLI